MRLPFVLGVAALIGMKLSLTAARRDRRRLGVAIVAVSWLWLLLLRVDW